MTNKVKVTTCSLGGCFGCHMSIMDIDEQFFELARLVEFTRTPLTDVKQIVTSDVGILEGGVCNSENIEILKEFRKNTKTLVALGACAITGGVPAMRNQYSVEQCLRESYIDGAGLENPQIPNDPEIPLVLNQVHPLHEVVKIDYFLPGCPPPASAILSFLQNFIEGKPIDYSYQQIHFD